MVFYAASVITAVTRKNTRTGQRRSLKSLPRLCRPRSDGRAVGSWMCKSIKLGDAFFRRKS